MTVAGTASAGTNGHPVAVRGPLAIVVFAIRSAHRDTGVWGCPQKGPGARPLAMVAFAIGSASEGYGGSSPGR